MQLRILIIYSRNSTHSQTNFQNLTHLESSGTLASKDGLESTTSAMSHGELDLGVQDLLDVGATNLSSGQLSNTDDLDGAEAAAVTGSQVHVEALDGFGAAHGTEFLVHVVGTGTGVIAQPDTEVLDLQGLVLVDKGAGDDFTGGALDLLQLTQEVEETGLGDDFVGSEDAHLVELRSGILGGGQLATDDLVFEHG